MKHNAIARIIIWSIVIVLILGIMASVILGRMTFTSLIRGEPAQTSPVKIQTSPTVSTQPSQTRPAAQTTAPSTQQKTESAAVDGVVTVPAEGIRELEINWVSGNIQIQTADVAEIQITESGVANADCVMQVQTRGEKLSIAFSKGTEKFLGFGLHGELSKDLTIKVPQNWECQDLEIDVASAKVDVQNLTVWELEFNGASGECKFTDCIVDSLDVNTASGDVYFTGRLRDFDCEAASANIYADLSIVPEEMDLETMSGLMDITLPEDAGFTVSMESMKASFSSEFETTTQGKRYVCGDGQCKISVESMSGEVILRKG